MAVYKSCGVLGFFKPEATEEDFRAAGYDPSQFVTSCGFLGFQPKAAILYAIPEAWREGCVPLQGSANGTYEVTSPGACSLQSCAGGAFKVDGRCVAPGTSCVPTAPQPHASYTYAATGKCALASCAVGTVQRPVYGVSQTGSGKCPVGYAAVADEAACKAAAAQYGIPYGGTANAPGLLGGCVVHAASGQPAKANFNTVQGVDSGGDQFVVCGRGEKTPCVAKGAQCGTTSNYKWNAKGYCQGSCEGISERCVASERCCSGVCTPRSLKQCPDAQALVDEASNLGSQIHSLTGSFTQLSGSVKSIGDQLHGL